MHINQSINQTNFKRIEYIPSPKLQDVLSKQKESVTDVLKKAENELANTKSNLVLYAADDSFLMNYADLGKFGLTFIDGAVSDGKVLKVAGYTFDKENGLKNTRYIWCNIQLRSSKQASKYAEAINKTYSNDMYTDRLAKTVEFVKAFDKSI